MAHQLKPRTVEKVLNVVARARVEVIDTQHIVAVRNEPITEVSADEAGATSD